ncbi:MAG: hypothetical protein GF384_04865 [Elusimicrobia bacterium]|nr:hypothetical protein [Elusimicrobiota bacterium]
MPIVEGKISGVMLTKELTRELTEQITATLRDTISESFAIGLGYKPGTKEYDVAYKRTQVVMPGWTWVSLVNQSWAVQGKAVPDSEIVCRLHIFLLATAVSQPYRQKVAADVFKSLMGIFSKQGKKVHLVVDVIEGEIDMTLPEQIFGTLSKGEGHKLLTVPEVVEAMKKDIGRLLETAKI